MSSTAVIVPLLVNIVPNKLPPKVPNKIAINPPFCYFASFLIVSLMPFINKPDSSRDLTIFMILFISSLRVINVVVHKANSEGRLDPNIFL